MRRIITAILIGLSALGVTMQYGHTVSQNLFNNVYRLHVVANSDASYDQALKLKVRDRVIETIDSLVSEDTTLETTRKVAQDNLKLICAKAAEEIKNNGYNYPVTVSTGSFPFPTKHYENISLPKGKYQGLRISIGSGKGQNWWCVLYPNLCFIDGVVSMPEDSETKLKGALTDEELSIIQPKDGKVKLKFKIMEIFD